MYKIRDKKDNYEDGVISCSDSLTGRGASEFQESGAAS